MNIQFRDLDANTARELELIYQSIGYQTVLSQMVGFTEKYLLTIAK